MKTKYILLIILLTGCGLFKKTTKSSTASSFDLSKQTETQRLDLTTKQKEIQRYSYWEDSVFHQYEVIREQIDQTKASTVKAQENKAVKQEQALKESQPAAAWGFLIMLIVLGSVIFTMAMKNSRVTLRN